MLIPLLVNNQQLGALVVIEIDYRDPTQYIISVPKSYCTLVQTFPLEVRQLDLDTFRQSLNDLMDDELGMAYTASHFYTPPLLISGVTLSRVVEILDPFTITFENGNYNVNIVGGNSNVSDVVNKNTVGVNTANSAGLQEIATIAADAELARKHLTNKFVTDPATGIATLYDDDGVTVLETSQLYEDDAGAQTYRGQGAERREGFA